MHSKSTNLNLIVRAEPILLFFNLFFFPAFLFFDLNIFLIKSSYISYHNFFLVYLQLFSIHDCYIRVIHNMMTALLEYLNLPVVFLWAYYVELIRSIKVFPSLQCKLQFSGNHFPNFHLYFLNFALCFLASYFSKKNCRQNWCSPI